MRSQCSRFPRTLLSFALTICAVGRFVQTLHGQTAAGTQQIQASGQAASATQPGQADALANAVEDALRSMQPLLGEINQAVASIEVRRWKAPGDVKDTTATDVQSIQKDLYATLPGLLDKALAEPASVAPSFAVFRNIDALYDVLLRITETATLAGATAEADRLEQARAQLQARRGQLGNALLASAAARDNDLLQARMRLQAAAEAAPPKKIVVNDGPEAAPAKPARRKKPTTPTPAPGANPPAQ